MWFLPGVKWFKMRHLPYEETEVSIPDQSWLMAGSVLSH